MPLALVSSRSFAQVLPVGRDLLVRGGFEVHGVDDAERPLDGPSLARIVARERPDVLIAGAEPITRDVLLSSSTLRMVQKHGVGVDNIDVEAATAAGIAVANAPGTNTEAVADLAIAFMLDLLRSVTSAVESTRKGKWNRYIGNELGHRTVGVVGTGRIGRAVVQRLRGFGSAILGYDVYQDQSLVQEHGLRYVGLRELLRESDIVTLHIPLFDETRNLIGPTELEWMKPSAFLINVARGELVDEAALAARLTNGGLAGAGIDVFATEPPQASPLLRCRNVLATPHIGAYTHEAMECMDRTCAETVLEAFSRRESRNVLNPEAFQRWTSG
jgi:D-3-phosphoglycerate dehydrogenase